MCVWSAPYGPIPLIIIIMAAAIIANMSAAITVLIRRRKNSRHSLAIYVRRRARLSLTNSWPSAGRRLHKPDFAAFGHSQAPMPTAAVIPTSCAAINASTPAGAMPAKVLDSARATVTAGLANDVDAVNQ